MLRVHWTGAMVLAIIVHERSRSHRLAGADVARHTATAEQLVVLLTAVRPRADGYRMLTTEHYGFRPPRQRLRDDAPLLPTPFRTSAMISLSSSGLHPFRPIRFRVLPLPESAGSTRVPPVETPPADMPASASNPYIRSHCCFSCHRHGCDSATAPSSSPLFSSSPPSLFKETPRCSPATARLIDAVDYLRADVPPGKSINNADTVRRVRRRGSDERQPGTRTPGIHAPRTVRVERGQPLHRMARCRAHRTWN